MPVVLVGGHGGGMKVSRWWRCLLYHEQKWHQVGAGRRWDSTKGRFNANGEVSF